MLPVWPTSDLADSAADGEARPVAVESQRVPRPPAAVRVRGRRQRRALPQLRRRRARRSRRGSRGPRRVRRRDARSGRSASRGPGGRGLRRVGAAPAAGASKTSGPRYTDPGAIAHEPTGDRYADMLCSAGASFGRLCGCWTFPPRRPWSASCSTTARRSRSSSASRRPPEYAERVGGDVTPLPVGVDTLVRGWMLVAYGGRMGRRGLARRQRPPSSSSRPAWRSNSPRSASEESYAGADVLNGAPRWHSKSQKWTPPIARRGPSRCELSAQGRPTAARCAAAPSRAPGRSSSCRSTRT